MGNKINVLVTGAGGAGVGSQVIKALRIADTQYNIVATDVTNASSIFSQADKSYVVPLANDNDYIPKLLEICEKEKILALVPGSEQELTRISEHRELFKERGIFLLINDTNIVKLCMNKWETYKFLLDNGFNVPKTAITDDERVIGGAINLPLIVKPMSESFGSSNVYIAQNYDEAFFFIKYLMKQGIKPLVQEYIGSCDDEYTVGVLTDMVNGELIGSIALKRNISTGLSNRLKIKNRCSIEKHSEILAISSGVSQGEFNIYPDVREYCERIALKLGSKGAMNIQCRKYRGKVYPFEINPRHSGTTYLRAMVGFNEIDILIRKHILNKEISNINYRIGNVVRGTAEYLVSI
jgi:carbamoyl-phosphate synthase large subunit